MESTRIELVPSALQADVRTSYTKIPSVEIDGFEPSTFRVSGGRSNQLSYISICGISGIRTHTSRRLAVAHPYVLLSLVDTVGIEPKHSDCKSGGLPLTSGPKQKTLRL